MKEKTAVALTSFFTSRNNSSKLRLDGTFANSLADSVSSRFPFSRSLGGSMLIR